MGLKCLSLGGQARPVVLSPEEVDLIKSQRGPLLLEVNPCPGLEGIERWSEKNIAKEIILYAESLFNPDP